MAKKGATRRSWGWLYRLPSKKWRASYVGPDGARHNAPTTYSAKIDGEAWLAAERRAIEVGTWTPPALRTDARTARAVTVAEFTGTWIEQRSLKPRTKSGYEDLLRLHIGPTTLGRTAVSSVTGQAVRNWHAGLGDDYPTRNKHAYGLLHAVLETAVTDELLASNPARVHRAMNVSRKREPVILTVKQLATVADEVPDNLRAFVLISAWCGLRWGEAIELRRGDIGEGCEIITVARAATHRGGCRIDVPKSGKIRSVVVPPHIRGDIKHHLDAYVESKDADALVFEPTRGGHHLNDKVARAALEPALQRVDVKSLRIHDLRHFAGTVAANVGSLPETMARLGHSTQKASLQYQGRVSGADIVVAEELSRMAEDAER
ncbi:MAG: site-specific integrase [Actinomycetia bacterium]|nr:site-specific integrase [Actinomycetes bacterium]